MCQRCLPDGRPVEAIYPDLDKIVSDYELIMDNLRREMEGQPRKPIDKKLLTDPLGLFEERL